MSTATAGRAREHKVRDYLADRGYLYVMRAAGSKGPADLLFGHAFIGAVLVQVGTESKSLGPADRNRFCAAADMTGALPLLATVIPEPGKPTRILFHVVTRDIPSTWTEYKP